MEAIKFNDISEFFDYIESQIICDTRNLTKQNAITKINDAKRHYEIINSNAAITSDEKIKSLVSIILGYHNITDKEIKSLDKETMLDYYDLLVDVHTDFNEIINNDMNNFIKYINSIPDNKNKNKNKEDLTKLSKEELIDIIHKLKQ